ncbi:MAG: hypothetical protein GOMPHAMPRED_002441 [Gomphillus americanus]|uniref:Fungal calcium binding protein domain-containing protein n=1 Tax=Gomphillus americanus TaxID=1940652 RepID=A0A8H3IIA4_9LECA|nr:MAG: hypothetical protein GOMPHAMPRED_002441 [Gomphillus americanus]
MQSNILLNLIILVAAVSAVPAPISAPAPFPGLLSDIDAETALQHLSLKKAAGCSLLGCAAALAPTVVSCASAIAEEGVNVVEDFSCIAEAIRDGVDEPEECKGCF